MLSNGSEITLLLARLRQGDGTALDQLTPLVYQHLHVLACQILRRERSDHTLQPTALLNEAFLRLMEGSQPDWDSRLHFFAFAARIMRQVLIDYARRRLAQKRSGGRVIPLDAISIAAPNRATNLLALDESLTRLAEIDPRKARILELRYFAGLGIEQTGQTLGISESTVRRETRLAEAWLHRELSPKRPPTVTS